MAQFAAMNQRAPKHTAEEVKKEMKSFVDEHQHNSCEDIKKDLHEFVQDATAKCQAILAQLWARLVLLVTSLPLLLLGLQDIEALNMSQSSQPSRQLPCICLAFG